MPWHLPADLKHFKAITGKALLWAVKPESIGRALPGRPNIVITSNADYSCLTLQWSIRLSQPLRLLKHWARAERKWWSNDYWWRYYLPIVLDKADTLYSRILIWRRWRYAVSRLRSSSKLERSVARGDMRWEKCALLHICYSLKLTEKLELSAIQNKKNASVGKLNN